MIAAGTFFVFFALFALVGVGGLALGVATLISIARTPTEAFGPWWDNTRQTWLVGAAVAFVVPLGTLIAGVMWFGSARAPLRAGRGYVERPFWAGPSRPYPPPPPPVGWPAPPAPPPTAPSR